MNSKQQEKPHHHNHAYFIPVDHNHVSILGNAKTRKSFSTLQNKKLGFLFQRPKTHPMPTHHISSLSIIWSSDKFSLLKHLNSYNWQNNHGISNKFFLKCSSLHPRDLMITNINGPSNHWWCEWHNQPLNPRNMLTSKQR